MTLQVPQIDYEETVHQCLRLKLNSMPVTESGKRKANKPGVCLNLPEQTDTNLVCITRLLEHKIHELALLPAAGTDEASPIPSIYSTRTLRLKLTLASIDSLIDHQK